jgi:tetratricopeptide (TPR) repeat protein
MENHDLSKVLPMSLRVVLLCVLAVIASVWLPQYGWSQANPDQDRNRHASDKEELADRSEKISAQAFFPFINGVLYDEMGLHAQAAQSYRRALQVYPDSYEIRYDYALALYRLRSFEDVIFTLESIEPVDAEVHRLRAAAYRALGKRDSAVEAYVASINLDSTQSAVYSYLAKHYQEAGKLDSAAWAYRHLARLEPSDHLITYELGKLLADQGKLREAAEAFRSSLETADGKQNLMSYIRLGDVYRLMGFDDSSVAVFQRGHDLDSTNLLLNRLLAAHYIEADSFSVALPYARRIAEQAPDEPSGVRRLGVIYYVLDSLDQADSIFSGLVDRSSPDERDVYYRGRIAAAREDYKAARDHFARVVQMTETIYDAWLDLAWVYDRLGDPEQQIRTLRQGVEHCDDSAATVRLLMALGSAYEQNGQAEASVRAFENLLEMDPDFGPALNYLGYMLADRGERLNYALGLIEKAVAQDPDNAAYLDSYGWVYYRLGNYNEAITYLQRAAELDNDPTILDHLGDAYHEVGQTERARQWWQRALDLDPENEKIREKLER